MLNKVNFILLVLIFIWRHSESMKCKTGYEIRSRLITKRSWETVNCTQNNENTCIREEGLVVVYNAYDINITIGGCSSRVGCEQNCMDVSRSMLRRSISQATNFEFDVNSFAIRSCQQACCQNESCNRHTVASIKKMNQALTTATTETPTTTPTTRAIETTQFFTTIPATNTSTTSNTTKSMAVDFERTDAERDDVFECQDGFEVTSDLISTSSYNTTFCNRSLDEQCIRGEGAVSLFGEIQVNIISGFCGHRSTCNDSCNALFTSILHNVGAAVVDFNIMRCDLTCCNSPNCNNIFQSQTNDPPSLPGLVDDIIECVSGYEVISDLHEPRTIWTTVLCRKSLGQNCVRAKGILIIDGFYELNLTVGLCENESSKNDSCPEIFSSPVVDELQLDDFEFQIANCVVARCDKPFCNNESQIFNTTDIPIDRQLTTANRPTGYNLTELLINSTAITRTDTSDVIGTASFGTLHCSSGYSVISEIITESNWSLISCNGNSGQSCLRSEINARMFQNAYDFSLEVAVCVDQSVCQQSCEDLTRQLFFSSQSSITDPRIRDLNLQSVEINLLMCDFICCEVDNCNNNTIETIRDQFTTTTSSPLQSTTIQPSLLTKENSLECFSGYKVDSSLYSHESWRLTYCSADLQQTCIRAEGRGTIFGFSNVNIVVGFCAEQTECDNRICRDLNGYIRSGSEDVGEFDTITSDLVIRECLSVCCSIDKCNNHTIEEIKRSNEMVFDNTDNEGSDQNRCPGGVCNLEDDGNTLFLLSLAPSINKLKPQISSEVRLRFMEILHEAQFRKITIR